MGHLFVLCGTPGSGKTKLLRRIAESSCGLKVIRRITTREPRPEETEGELSFEYEFVDEKKFSARLAHGGVNNFVEWGGNLYATDLGPYLNLFQDDQDYLLLEDIPSAVHLKRIYRRDVTALLVFVDGAEELLRWEFPLLADLKSPALDEWKNRLEQKYFKDQEFKVGSSLESSEKYIARKMARAVPDLAFAAGHLRSSGDVPLLSVLPNRPPSTDQALQEFLQIVDSVRDSRTAERKTVFVLMPFDDESKKLYQFVIKPAVEISGVRCAWGDETETAGFAKEKIKKRIEMADVVIGDLSGSNVNVATELGIASEHTSPILLITRDTVPQVPFQLSGHSCKSYSDDADGWIDLHRYLRKVIQNMFGHRIDAPSPES